jgi:outer membrane protease
MKNITALAFLVIINCAFIFNNPLFSQEAEKGRYAFTAGPPAEKSRYKFSVSPQTGIVYGQAFEYVYPQGTKAELLSELKWDMKPVFYAGLQLDFEPADIMRSLGFFSSVSFKAAGLPKDSGVMEDRDWMSIENSALTHFSRHTNRTNKFYVLDAVVGISFPVKSIVCIKTFLIGSWMHFSFTGRNGYYEYAREKMPYYNTYYPIENNPQKGKFSGNVINYKQDWLLAAAGFSIETKVLAPFSLNLSFQISPFAYCNALDEHINPNTGTSTFYNDLTSMGFYFEPKLNLAFNMKRIDLSLDVAYRRIGKTSGKSYKNEKNSGYYLSPNKAGAGLSILDARFLVKINLFGYNR